MKKMHWLTAFLCLLALNITAYADDVPPEPPSCPNGSYPDTGHEGPHCSPLSCTTDADCKGGLSCQEFPLCLEEQMLAPGKSREPSKYVFVYSTCEDPSACKAPNACQAGKRCVAKAGAPTPMPTPTPETKSATSNPTPPAPTPAPKAGGCAVSAEGSGDAALLALSLFLGWMTRRRSARR